MGMYERQLLGYNSKLLSIGGKLLRLYATGLYTFEEVNTMILMNGYIPVANASELDDLGDTGTRTMGAGTVWEGTYTIGTDKKYVQVENIECGSFATEWKIRNFSGTYDGNELQIRNPHYENTSGNATGIFYLCTGVTLKNIRVINGTLIQTTGSAGRGFIASHIDSTSIIDNCFASGTINASTPSTTTSACGGIVGYNTGGTVSNCVAQCNIDSTVQYNGGCVGSNTGTITNSSAQGTLTVGQYSGGFVGTNTGTITGCYASTTMVVTAGNGFSGGFVGYSQGASSYISKCYCNVSLSFSASNTNNQSGGFAGAIYNNGLVEDCYAAGSINTYRRSGGFVGQQGLGGSRLTNCYAAVAVTAVNSSGGFSGYNGGGTHVVTNCYFDSDVSIITTTLYGLARTTKQMQEGTADSFILPAGGTDPDSLAANAMYTSWDDVDTWDFGTTSDYPTLK